MAGPLDIIRNPFRTVAERARRAADAAREAWQGASRPVASAGRARIPGIDWFQDQPPAQPQRFGFQSGYNDHTFQQFSAPLAFDFGPDRITDAIASHRAGQFFESSALMVSALGYAPVLAAAQQAIAPILACTRHVHAGPKGLAKLIGGEIREQLCPRNNLLPSPYFPPALWGTLAIHLRFLGFSTLQHVDGEPDEETGVRPRYSRIWEPWAVQRQRNPRKAIAYTTEGPVEIKNDGKFTLIECVTEGHLHQAAIVALAPEAAAAKITALQRLAWLDFFASPKLVAMLPEHVPTQGPAGDAFLAAVDAIYGPGGRGALPYGSDVKAVNINGQSSDQFDPAIIDGMIRIFMVLTGTAGTIGNGASTGSQGVPYQPAKGGAWTVRHDLIAEPALAICQGINAGHVAPYIDINYGEQVERAKRAGAWESAVLEIPVPAPDKDERIASAIGRYKALTDQVAATKAAGGIVDQAQVDALAETFEVKPFQLVAPARRGDITAEDMGAKLFTPDEYRAQKGYGPLSDGMGTPERLAQERAAGGDETGALAKVEAADAKDEPAAGAPAGDEEQGPGTRRSGQGGAT